MRALILLAGLLTLSVPAVAETMFVTDILRLGLHNTQSTTGSTIRTLVSGTELEVLEKTRYSARVRTTDGTAGWVKLGYLVDEKPAQARLQELERQREQMAAELATLQKNLSTQEQDLRELTQARSDAEQRAGAGASELKRLTVENQTLSERLAAYRFSVPLEWLLTITAATLIGGFLAGLWWIDHRSRQRHGGFRIY